MNRRLAIVGVNDALTVLERNALDMMDPRMFDVLVGDVRRRLDAVGHGAPKAMDPRLFHVLVQKCDALVIEYPNLVELVRTVRMAPGRLS